MIKKNIDAIYQIPKRFYSLDVLRGFAALVVVLFHWQHFFYIGSEPKLLNFSIYPFSSVFHLFYVYGYLAVELFFSISGFVFFWLYSQKIYEKKINGLDFLKLRFSRLYPLHFITLLLVLLLQVVSVKINRSYFVYSNTDTYHFILNLFFISSWGIENGLSFNGPTWSVSIEVLLYIIFFIYSALGGAQKLWISILIVLISLFLKILPFEISKGLFSFFIGGVCFLIYLKLIKFNLKVPIILLVAFITITWIVLFINDNNNFIYNLTINHQSIYKLSIFLSRRFITGILFPIMILALTLIETSRGTFLSRFKFIGDITYSTYLIHFPLQFIFVLMLPLFSLDRSFFLTILSMVVFFTILIFVSSLSFKYIEKPFQNILRKNV